jgi:glycosyltransferase involved in cell wall biosynthesis
MQTSECKQKNKESISSTVDITVVIPYYNDQVYIEQCINSVLIQEGVTLEIIIIDDGSLENASKFAKIIADKHTNIKYVYQQNSRQGTARNHGMKLACGKYVFFMDSDDYLEGQCLLELFKMAEYKLADIVTYDANSFIDDSQSERLKVFIYEHTLVDGAVLQGKQFFNYCIAKKEFFVVPWIYFFRRKFLIDSNLSFPQYIVYEDTPAAYKYINSADRIVYIKRKFYCHRIRSGSTMTQKISTFHITSNNVAIEYMNEWYQKEKENKSSNIREELHYLQMITSSSWRLILKCNEKNSEYNMAIKKYSRILKKFPYLISYRMILDIAKGLGRRIQILIDERKK